MFLCSRNFIWQKFVLQKFFFMQKFVCRFCIFVCRNPSAAEICMQILYFFYADSECRNLYAEIFWQQKFVCSFCIFFMQILYAEICMQKFVWSFCISVCRNPSEAEICMQILYFFMQILYAEIFWQQKFVCSFCISVCRFCKQKFFCSRNL